MAITGWVASVGFQATWRSFFLYPGLGLTPDLNGLCYYTVCFKRFYIVEIHTQISAFNTEQLNR